MNKEKFMVTCQYGNQEVEGCRFVVEGFEFLDTFVYKHDGSFAIGDINIVIYSAEELKDKYVVSEAKTGRWLGEVCEHPEEAAYKAELKLKEIGVERARACLEKHINET